MSNSEAEIRIVMPTTEGSLARITLNGEDISHQVNGFEFHKDGAGNDILSLRFLRPDIKFEAAAYPLGLT